MCSERNAYRSLYDQVNKLLSAIANHLQTDARYQHPEAMNAMIEHYNEKAIDTFTRGLDGNLGKFWKNFKAKSLAQAQVKMRNTEKRV